MDGWVCIYKDVYVVTLDSRRTCSKRPSAAIAQLDNGRFDEASLFVVQIYCIAPHDGLFRLFALLVAPNEPVADRSLASINRCAITAMKTRTVCTPGDVPRRHVG